MVFVNSCKTALIRCNNCKLLSTVGVFIADTNNAATLIKNKHWMWFTKPYTTVTCKSQALLTNDFVNNYHYNLMQIRRSHFKAAVIKVFKEELEIKEIKSPKKLDEQEVRIKIHNCAVNVTDLLIWQGEYDTKLKLPFIPGYEFSGEVTETGSGVKGLASGDKVIGLNKEGFSGFAEECIMDKKDLWKIPQDISFESAAALVDSYATVLIAARRANLQEGDAVLVTAASGGLGLAAVDLAANLFKAKVIGACDTEDNASLLRDKGAFAAINYSKKEITDAVMKATNKVGVKVVFDAVVIGACDTEDNASLLRDKGAFAAINYSKKEITDAVMKATNKVGVKVVFDAVVIGACDTEDNASLLRDKGAFAAINYSKKEITDAVMKATNKVGVKVVFDAVGGDIFDDCLQSVAPEGSIIVAGFASRKIPLIMTNQLLPKSCALIGVSLTHYRQLSNEMYRNTVQEVIDMYLEEFIDPHIAANYELEKVNDAIKFIEERKSTGKVILDIH